MMMNDIVDGSKSVDALDGIKVASPGTMPSSAMPGAPAPSEIQPVASELQQPLSTPASSSLNTDVFTDFKSTEEGPDKSRSTENPTNSQLAPSGGGTLDLIVDDAIGHPIAGIGIKVFVKKEVIFIGKTDKYGCAPPIKNIPFGSVFEIHVKKNNGEYKFAAIGKIQGGENVANLKSPKTRFEFSTYEHVGEPGKASDHKKMSMRFTTSQHHQFRR